MLRLISILNYKKQKMNISILFYEISFKRKNNNNINNARYYLLLRSTNFYYILTVQTFKKLIVKIPQS